MSKKNNHKLKGGALKGIKSMFRSKINHGPSMNIGLNVDTMGYLKDRKYSFNGTNYTFEGTEEAINLEIKAEEDRRLEVETEKKDNEIKKLRNHSNLKPSIFMQNSHSNQTTDCLKVPKNTLIIFLGASGEISRIGSEQSITDPKVINLLKQPITTKPEMDERLTAFINGNWWPMITFHYSNYFGITPSGDSKRQKCEFNTTESYYDNIYSCDNSLRATGFTTLDQFVNNIEKNVSNSLDISPYHTKQKLGWSFTYKKWFGMENLQDIKNKMPYFDIRHPTKSEQPFINSEQLSKYYFDTYRSIFQIMNYYYFNGVKEDKKSNGTIVLNYKYSKDEGVLKQKLSYSSSTNWDKIKLSELLEINGPGIYIHWACRPFEQKNHDMIQPTRANSINTIRAARCPIRTEIYDNNITVGKYYGCSRLKKITIGKDVKILDGAFENCTSLTEVTFDIPSTLNKIISGSFSNCNKLVKINIPISVKKIGDKLNHFQYQKGEFQECSNLNEIRLPEKLEIISEQTFYYCTSLTKITLSKNLKRIEKKAFFNCKNLNNITLPDTLEYIGDMAFKNCINLKVISLPNTLETLDYRVFEDCSKLKTIKLSDNIEIIHYNTFRDCKKLTTINIPKKLKKIHENAFLDCESLTKLYFPSEIQNIDIDEYSFDSDGLKNVSFYSNTKINSKDIQHLDNKNIFPKDCEIVIRDNPDVHVEGYRHIIDLKKNRKKKKLTRKNKGKRKKKLTRKNKGKRKKKLTRKNKGKK